MLTHPVERTMDPKKLRVVTLTCEGDTQQHLVHRIGMNHQLAGCVTMATRPYSFRRRLSNKIVRYIDWHRFARQLDGRKAVSYFDEAAQKLHKELFFIGDQPAPWPVDIPRIHVDDVNNLKCLEFVKKCNPDVIVVNGTNLLRKPYFEFNPAPRFGIINIHTGLSPYCRGGNCNLYAILHKQIHLVGVTVHYIDQGIDSGDIIFTERPTINLGDTFESLENKVFRLGEDLLLLALESQCSSPLHRTKQWQKGQLFLKRTGYIYEPFHRLAANRVLDTEKLIQQYLHHRENYDASVRICPPAASESTWRHHLI